MKKSRIIYHRFSFSLWPGSFIRLECSSIASIGKNSMVWLVSHWILLTMCRIVVDDMLGISNSYILAAVMASVCIFIIPLLSRLLNKPDLSWTIGK